jgi:hypothetical protein
MLIVPLPSPLPWQEITQDGAVLNEPEKMLTQY